VQHQVEVAGEREDDPLAQPPQSVDAPAERRPQRRLDGAQQERALEPDGDELGADDPRSQRGEIELDVG
jgi:hypothetical protein